MGSRPRHSSGRKAKPRAPGAGVDAPTGIPSPFDSTLAEAMDRLDEAIAVVSSAASAFTLQQAEEGAVRSIHEVNAEALRCLQFGARLLRMAYKGVDAAMVNEESAS